MAYNDQCAECLTYASATQIVLGFSSPVRFTDEGRRRLAALYQSLRDLEGQELTLAQLHAAVTAAKAELLAILDEELVEVPAGEEPPAGETDGSTTSTTAPPDTGNTSSTLGQSTSSTVLGGSTTSSSSSTSTTATTSSTATSTASTTAEPTTTTAADATTTTTAAG